jgi:sialate O-acetylesterase
LQKALDVPIGLIHTSVGGTPAESWTSKRVLESDPAFEDLVKKGSTLYNGMIAPLMPFAIKGAIWYQGESNANTMERALQYEKLFPAMIKNWRDDWKQGDFPFLYVQLAPYDRGAKPVTEPVDTAWARLREAQRLTLKTPHTGMAVITDVGEKEDIHPKQKEPVGARLALAARAIAYGEKIEFSGPTFGSVKFADGKAILSFKHLGGGLVAKGDALTGFTIAGEDKVFHNAEAAIQGDTIVVSSTKVAKPVAVRFGWANYPVVNLWNKEGLPASPFRTDDWAVEPKMK